MKSNRIHFYTYLVVTISVAVLLITGAPVLTMPVDNADTIPLGTFITWAGLVSLTRTIFFGIKEIREPSSKTNEILAGILKVISFLSVLWLPISYFLAGNLSFTFTESSSFQGGQLAMKCFWIYSTSIVIGAIMVVLIYWISIYVNKRNVIANHNN